MANSKFCQYLFEKEREEGGEGKVGARESRHG